MNDPTEVARIQKKLDAVNRRQIEDRAYLTIIERHHRDDVTPAIIRAELLTRNLSSVDMFKMTERLYRRFGL